MSQLEILVANGPNLDLLGRREPGIYGKKGLTEIEADLKPQAAAFAASLGLGKIRLSFFQSNHEGLFLDEIAKPWDGLLVNAGAWTHTSLAIADRLVGLAVPFVEVHLSNLSKREEFRKHSFLAPHASGVVYGFGADSYSVGLFGLLLHLKQNRSVSP